MSPVMLLLLPLILTLAAARAPTIPLPLGFQPEGITHGGRFLYVGQVRNGAILRVNPKTNNSRILVPPFRRRVAVGMWVMGKKLFVAGGGEFPIGAGSPGFFYVYNTETGKQIAACRVKGARFINDVIVVRGKAYFTDSASNKLVVVPVKSVRKCKFSALKLPGAFRRTEVGGVRGNGIEFFRGRLLVANSDAGTIYAVDLKGRRQSRALLPVGTIPGPDGLVVKGNKLYVVDNRAEVLTVWKLRVRPVNGKLVAKKVRTIRDKTFNSPATGAILKDKLYVANSRFAELAPDADISKELFTISVLSTV